MPNWLPPGIGTKPALMIYFVLTYDARVLACGVPSQTWDRFRSFSARLRRFRRWAAPVTPLLKWGSTPNLCVPLGSCPHRQSFHEPRVSPAACQLRNRRMSRRQEDVVSLVELVALRRVAPRPA